MRVGKREFASDEMHVKHIKVLQENNFGGSSNEHSHDKNQSKRDSRWDCGALGTQTRTIRIHLCFLEMIQVGSFVPKKKPHKITFEALFVYTNI